MTYKNLQDRVMARLNLTSAESRTRIKNFLNERYRTIATSVSLGKVRFGTVTFNTVIGTYEYTPTTLLHGITFAYPVGRTILDERSMDQIRLMDPGNTRTGPPQFYVQEKYGATTETIYIWPKPDAIYAIQVDGILAGTDMSGDSDVPVLPEDFHDALEFAAVADELAKMEKWAASTKFEAKAETRVRELRYFIGKSAYLDLQQGQGGNWWWGPWFGTYRGFN